MPLRKLAFGLTKDSFLAADLVHDTIIYAYETNQTDPEALRQFLYSAHRKEENRAYPAIPLEDIMWRY